MYAGTALEEGELVIRVREVSGSTRYEKIVSMIEETEKLKSAMESRAEHLADRLVPYTFAGTILTGLLTRNVTKAVSVLMVDFFLRLEACYASECPLCYPGGPGVPDYRQGRQVPGSGGGCGHHCL